MTAMESEPRKKPAKKDKVDEPTLHVVEAKPKVKPGAPDYDWQAEYPGEDVYVYTVPKNTRSQAGLTVGLAKFGPTRSPRPGKLRRLYKELEKSGAAGNMNVMWYYIEVASSPNSLGLQEELEDAEYAAMLRGWAEFAGVELSE